MASTTSVVLHAIATTGLVTALAISQNHPAWWWMAGLCAGIDLLHISVRLQRRAG